jgi:hypothetical protein
MSLYPKTTSEYKLFRKNTCQPVDLNARDSTLDAARIKQNRPSDYGARPFLEACTFGHKKRPGKSPVFRDQVQQFQH